jgi:type IV pilus assembly protein PilN
MRISVNLASRPFIELRPLLRQLRIAMYTLGALALILGVVLHYASARAQENAATMRAMEQKTNQLQAERVSNENSMRQPVNAAVLEQSQFLNGLFAQKAFSWTAVMMDLENVLPAGVQVTSIDPTIDKTGAVIIRLRVSGDRDKAVDLLRNLESSKHFLEPRLADEASQSTDTTVGGSHFNAEPVLLNAVEFDIFAGYNPLPLHDVHTDDDSATDDMQTKGGK